MEMLKWEVEVTDTFGGEANYAWIRRYTFEAPRNASDSTIMRRAKAAASLNGVRGRAHNYGDTLEFRPYRDCIAMFVVPVLD